MFRTASTLTLGFLVVLTGCPGDDGTTTGASAGSTAAESTDSSPTTNASADSTAGPATSGQTTDAPGTTTDAPTTDAPTTDAPTSDSTGSGEECAMCVEAACPDELAACAMDVDCTCFQDCAALNPGIPGALACADQCGIPVLDLMNDTTVVGALSVCSQANCPVCLM